VRANRINLFIGFLTSVFGVIGCSDNASTTAETVVHAKPMALKDGAAVVIGSAIGTDTPVAMPVEMGYYPALTSDGKNFFSVQTINSKIRGSLVDANGEPINLEWIDFGVADYGQYYADVTYGAGHYLVSWWNNKNDGTDSSITGRLVNADGTLVGSSNIKLSTGDGLYPTFCWDGAHFIGAWITFIDAKAIVQYALFDADGTKVASSERVIPVPGGATTPQIVAGTNRTLLAWKEYEPDSMSGTYNIRAVFIDKMGAVLNDPPLSIGPSGYVTTDLAVASSGSRFLVTYDTQQEFNAVQGLILDELSNVIADEFPISHSTADAANPSIDFDGTQFVVAWADARGDTPAIFGTAVSLDGTVSSLIDRQLSKGGPSWVSTNSSDRTSLVFNGNRHMLSYYYQGGIDATIVDFSMNIVKDQFVVPVLPGKQGYPRAVFDGSHFVLVWTDESDPDFSRMALRSVRIDGLGHVVDPEGIAITTPGSNSYTVTAASANNGSTLLAYPNLTSIPSLQVMNADGTLGSTLPLCETEECEMPSLTSNGKNYLAAYSVWNSNVNQSYLRIVDLAGKPGSAIPVGTPTGSLSDAPVPIKNGYVLPYVEAVGSLLVVNDSGTVTGSLDVASNSMNLTGAYSGDESIIVWVGADDYKVRARFFRDSTWDGDEIVISDGIKNDAYPAVVWDGTGYYVAWETHDGNWGSPHQILGRSVSRNRTLGPIQTLTTEDSTGAVLNSDRQGHILLTYLRWIADSNSRRVTSRLLTPEGTTPSDGTGGTGSGGQSSIPTTVVIPPGGASSVNSTSMAGGSSSTGGSSISSSVVSAGNNSVGSSGGGFVVHPSCSVRKHVAPQKDPIGFFASILGALMLLRRNRR
jgi:hypothetical protein